MMKRTIHVLLVDDCGITRKVVTRSLKETGVAEFVFTEAVDGVEALEKFLPNEMDLVLTDLQMPRMDGPELVRKLRETFTPCPPIVMITSETDQDRLIDALDRAAVDAVLIKPINVARLRKGIRSLLATIPTRQGPSAVPHGECVSVAFREMMEQTCGLELTDKDADEADRNGNVVLGAVSIVGDVQWSVILGYQLDTAVAVAGKFAGFEIPRDSPDLGDAIGEISNIVGGHIKRLLSKRSLDAEISLPSVVRATEIRTLVQSKTTRECSHFDSPVGKMWTVVTVGVNPGLVM
jgi:CheY-like chemotaxis protein